MTTTITATVPGASPRPGAGPGRELPGTAPDSDTLAAVHQYAMLHGGVSTAALDRVAAELRLSSGEVFTAVARLVEMHMLRSGDEPGTVLLPVDARSAAVAALSPIERAILQQREQADRLRARIDAVAGACGPVPGPLGVIDRVEGEAEVRGLLRLAAAECRTDVLTLRPGTEAPEIGALFDACCAELDGGQSVRVLAPHRDRADFASRTRVIRLVERGAELRTIRAVPQGAMVFDRSLAVVVEPGADGLPPTARPVTEATMAGCLSDMFELLWESASAFTPDGAGYDGDIADDFQRSIAQLMSQGLTDEAVARRLGMSVRTCRRHIAALMRSLGSVSRFQAGVQLAQRLATGQPPGAELGQVA
ncbi:helix-turn-helix transcriptional regulator [Streptomyces otsuchiensis]|uniref:helix-turn-helix transcriptional regulator n=1 Tax=Streptomyces otsuchiensis TaxID=2681388 RepID=UPI001031FDFC|nr:helix-turn-helix transcriptional regulator [Streptomyces otsuchiensis]